MKKSRENKNDKIIIIFIGIVLFVLLSWIIEAKRYSGGVLAPLGFVRLGLFDFVPLVISGIDYSLENVLFLLGIGGMYGVLTKTVSYKKIVSGAANLIEGRETIAFAVITLIVGLLASIFSNPLILLVIVPFILSVFAKNGQDRIVSVCAAFGGIFIGLMCQTFSNQYEELLYNALSIKVMDDIVTKIVIFLIAFVIFNVFGILRIIKRRNEELDIIEAEETGYDIFAIDESKEEKKKYIPMWPSVVVFIITLLIIILGYIPWNAVFKISLFETIYNAITGVTVGGIELFGSLLGTSIDAFGKWSSPIIGLSFLTIGTLIIASLNKLSLKTILNSYGIGAKKIARPTFMFALSFTFIYLFITSPWPTSLVDSLLNPNSYNIIFILLAAILGTLFCGDPRYSGYYFGSYIGTAYTNHLALTGILWTLGSGLAMIFGPTSYLLMFALTYVELPYSKWLKYIWKFVLTLVLVVLIVVALIAYV